MAKYHPVISDRERKCHSSNIKRLICVSGIPWRSLPGDLTRCHFQIWPALQIYRTRQYVTPIVYQRQHRRYQSSGEGRFRNTGPPAPGRTRSRLRAKLPWRLIYVPSHLLAAGERAVVSNTVATYRLHSHGTNYSDFSKWIFLITSFIHYLKP